MNRLALRVSLLAGLLSASSTAQISLHQINGANASDFLGSSVAFVGDLDGDGRDEFAVSARGADVNGSGSGTVEIRSGADASILFAVHGAGAGDSLDAVSGAGDVNDDGTPDFVVGAPLDDDQGTNSGRVSVYSGLDGGLLYTWLGDSASDALGVSVAGAGDVNNDGFADVVAGASGDDDGATNGGSARVFSGNGGGVLWTWYGQHFGGSFGYSVDGAGNADGDAFDDVVIGANHEPVVGSNSGSVTIRSGQSGAVVWSVGGAPSDQLGESVAGCGDVDADGRDDVIGGAILADPNGDASGSATVFSGATGAVIHVFGGDATGDQLGHSVDGAGDFDGDGTPDLVAGAPKNNSTGNHAGMARVYSGASGAVLQTYFGKGGSDNFGGAVAGGGDTDADGLADVVVGAFRADPTFFFAGQVRVFVGLPASCQNTASSYDYSHDGVPDDCQVCQPNLTAEGPGNMHLVVCGDDLTQAGSTSKLVVSKGTPGEAVYILFSLDKNPTPGLGGVIYPFPNPWILTAVLDSDGIFAFAIPGGVNTPLTVYTQAIAPWPGGTNDYEISGATAITVGF